MWLQGCCVSPFSVGRVSEVLAGGVDVWGYDGELPFGAFEERRSWTRVTVDYQERMKLLSMLAVTRAVDRERACYRCNIRGDQLVKCSRQTRAFRKIL